MSEPLIFAHHSPAIIVVDDWLVDPMEIRRVALEQEFLTDNRFYKGARSKAFLYPFVKERMEQLIGKKISNWTNGHATNGVFQYTTKSDPLVYHSDSQSYAAACYLNPDPPPNTGTSFWRSKVTGMRTPPDDALLCERMYGENVLKSGAWELTDKVENVFGRLVVWNGSLVHSASGYFGDDPETGRLVQLFFFDVV